MGDAMSAREEAERIMDDYHYTAPENWRDLVLFTDLRDAIEAALVAAHHRGEEGMRERAAKVAEAQKYWTGKYIAEAIRALPGEDAA
jgi:hypothetical protein